MKFKIRFAEQIVGIFIIAAVAALVGILIFMGINKRWLADDVVYTSQFNTGQGLRTGMAITLKGFEIGEVKSLTLNDDNLVDASLLIYEEYAGKILKDSVIEYISDPLGLSSGLVFYAAIINRGLIPPGGVLPNLHMDEGKLLVRNKMVDRSADTGGIAGILSRVEPLLVDVNDLVVTLNDTIMGLELDTLMYTLNKTMNDVDATVVSVNRGLNGSESGPVGHTLNNVSTMSDNAVVMTETLKGITDDVNKTTSSLTVLAKSLEDPTGLVLRLLDADGSITTLLNDDNVIFDKLVGIIDEVALTFGHVEDLARALSDTSPQISALLDSTLEAVDKGQDVLEGIKNNPLLRGGIPDRKEQPATFRDYREEDI